MPTVSLYGGHCIWTVQTTAWIEVTLDGTAPPLTPQEQARLRAMKELIISGLHYYCETLDVTRCGTHPPQVPIAQGC
jgi:hypothetical protein